MGGKSRIPENKPENKEPAEGSRQTVTDENPRRPTRPERPRPYEPPPRGTN